MHTTPLSKLPTDQTVQSWLSHLLPRSREPYDHHLTRTQQVIANNSIDTTRSLIAQDDRGPLGLTILTGSKDKRQLEMLAVRGDRRQRGLGKILLEQTIDLLTKDQIKSLTASSVSSANPGATRLFESFDFDATLTSGIRMRRSLDIPLPEYKQPDGFTIRALQPGEEEAWIDMKNRAFGEDGGKAWTIDNFHNTFTNEACSDYNRIFVALKDNYMVATTSAWEINYGEGPVGLIHWVGTDPKYRGHGLGYALNLRALEELAARGYPDAWLNTSLWRESAVRLYERFDFHIHRRTTHYTLTL